MRCSAMAHSMMFDWVPGSNLASQLALSCLQHVVQVVSCQLMHHCCQGLWARPTECSNKHTIHNYVQFSSSAPMTGVVGHAHTPGAYALSPPTFATSESAKLKCSPADHLQTVGHHSDAEQLPRCKVQSFWCSKLETTCWGKAPCDHALWNDHMITLSSYHTQSACNDIPRATERQSQQSATVVVPTRSLVNHNSGSCVGAHCQLCAELHAGQPAADVSTRVLLHFAARGIKGSNTPGL